MQVRPLPRPQHLADLRLGRGVVDDDDLVLAAGRPRARQGVQAARDPLGGAVGHDDDGQLDGHDGPLRAGAPVKHSPAG